MVNQKYYKTSPSPFRTSTKIIEFDNVKSTTSVLSKDGVWRKFLETESNSMFSKKGVLKKLVTLLSVNKFSFHPHFFKSWVHISDNIASVVGGSQYSYRGYRHSDFLLSNNYLDDVFAFKDLLGFEKT